jgi:small subunit ribosomal protein S20
MPITKSAKKALRQSLRKKEKNLIKKNNVKACFKEIKKLIEKKEIKEAEKLLPKFYKAVDKAAKTGVIKKNTASRKKSRTTKMIK